MVREAVGNQCLAGRLDSCLGKPLVAVAMGVYQRIMFWGLSRLILLPLSVASAWSQTLTNGDWVYRTNASNEATVTAYLGAAEHVLIPEELGGSLVRQIGNGRPPIFGWTNTTVKSVAIPGTVRVLGSQAFANCRALTNLHLPSGVTNVAPWAISGCWNLENIAVDPSSQHFITVDGVLFNKTQSALVVYPAGRNGAYVVPSSVVTISNTAFAKSVGLSSVIVGSNVTELGYSVFYGCTQLLSILFCGPAPVGGENLFFSSSPTVFYLTGIGDWPTTFYGRPTQVFVPEVQLAELNVDATFTFSWTNTGSIPMNVRRATSLDGQWTVVSTNNATGQFVDPNPPSGNAFYQAYLP
jgi:hypothetical protein